MAKLDYKQINELLEVDLLKQTNIDEFLNQETLDVIDNLYLSIKNADIDLLKEKGAIFADGHNDRKGNYYILFYADDPKWIECLCCNNKDKNIARMNITSDNKLGENFFEKIKQVNLVYVYKKDTIIRLCQEKNKRLKSTDLRLINRTQGYDQILLRRKEDKMRVVKKYGTTFSFDTNKNIERQ